MIAEQQPSGQDQADALRQLAAGRHHSATAIAVTSGKGGVGKTSVAVNLAVALAARGLGVTLLDLDLGLANADLMLNVQPRRNLSHLLSGTHDLAEILVAGPCGMQLVPGASGLERLANLQPAERESLLRQFQALERRSRFLIMDLGAGVGSNVLAFAAAADIVLVVTTPEPTALTDAYAAVKMLYRQHQATEIEVLVNQADSAREARLTYERLASVAGRFLGLAVLSAGYVLEDPAVPAAVRARRPFVLQSPRSNASAGIQALAERYARGKTVTETPRGFFARVAHLFQQVPGG